MYHMPHNNCKGQTGAMKTLCGGAITIFSRKQRIITKSSTDPELIGVYEGLPQILWTRYFLEEQGYAIYQNVLYQDNQSAMILKTNGKTVHSKWTKHIKN